MEYNDYELVYLISENEEAFECMVRKYEPLFKKLAYSFIMKYKNKGLDFDDIVQHCRIVFCKVLDMYSPNNDVLFYSYLVVCLNRSVSNYVKRYISKNDNYNYMEIDNYDNLECFTSSYNVYDNYADYEFQLSIIDFKHSLSFIDSCVFDLRYNGFSYKDIAFLLDLDVKKVDNLLVKIRKKLEKYFLFS